MRGAASYPMSGHWCSHTDTSCMEAYRLTNGWSVLKRTDACGRLEHAVPRRMSRALHGTGKVDYAVDSTRGGSDRDVQTWKRYRVYLNAPGPVVVEARK